MKFWSLLYRLFTKDNKQTPPMKKYLIVGLGNIGSTYVNTRHNIGFKILNTLAATENVKFSTKKLGDIASFKFKGRTFILLKPSTFMNLSGKAVKYWLTKEKIALENVLIVCDDLNISFGTFRLKPKGSAGGHNGLKDINEVLQTQKYPRFRFGVGAEFKKGRQVDYVLGKWNTDETDKLTERIDKATKLIKYFGTAGVANTMSEFNGN